VLVGGAGGTVAAAAGIPVAVHLFVVAAASLVAGQHATRLLVAEPRGTDRPSLTIPGGRLSGLGVLAFGAFLVDGAASNWSAAQVRQAGGGDTMAAAAFAAFALGLMVARLRGDGAEGVQVVQRSGLIASAGIAVVLLAPAAAISVAGWLVVGLGIARVAPAIMRAAGATPASIAAVTTVGYLGSFAGPPLIGAHASLTTLSVALLIPLLAALCVAALAPACWR
jgi:hypothetical protein